MIKKILGVLGVALLCGLQGVALAEKGGASVIQLHSQPKIEVVAYTSSKGLPDFAQEQALFIKFYSGLYADKKVQDSLKITDLAGRLKKTFADEYQAFQAGQTIWVRAIDAEKKVIAFVILSDQKELMRIKRCAIDHLDKEVVEALYRFIFKKYTLVKRLANVCLKESLQEIQLLKAFGFKECALIDQKYDATLYTSFALDRPVA